jgi:hypothetical protein
VTHTCNTSYLGGRDQEDRGSRQNQAKSETLFKNNLKAKRAGGVAQVIEHLPSKLKALHLSPIQPKDKNKKIARCQ